MLVKPIFMLLGCPFNFSSDHPNAKVSVDVAVTGVLKGMLVNKSIILKWSLKVGYAILTLANKIMDFRIL
jgi:hypothetical protein